MLCLLGAGLGLALATWTLQLLLPVIVSRLPLDWAMETRHLPFFSTTPDLRVLGFTALLTLGATLVAGLVPAWYASGASLIATVRNDTSIFARRLTPSRLRQLLVIVQVAVSLTLLSCAGLLVRNLLVRQKAGLGYDAQSVFGVSMVPYAGITHSNEVFRQQLETVRTLPGVAASGVANPPPLLAVRRVSLRATEASGTDVRTRSFVTFITNGFFDAFNISLLRGRMFRDEEQHSSAQVVIVSETLARRLWPDREAVGQTLAVSDELWADFSPGAVETFRECQVIGVARDIMAEALRDDRRQIYVPVPLDTWTNAPVFVRPSVVSTTAMAGIVSAANAQGFDFQFGRRHSFWVEYFVLPIFAFAVVSAALGLLALGMASVGLHGLMSFSVHRRVHEIGIRMALGATREKIVGLFVRQGMRLVGIGLVLGVIGGAIFALLMSKIFSEMVNSFDPVALAVVTLLFTIIAVFACWLPARRATKVDPMVALRAE